jgi:16S rRNA (guanine527-N7)-methyltransferase
MSELNMGYLAEGAANLGIKLGSYELEQFDIYYRELLEWNSRINLTSITDLKDVQVKHFLDSLIVIKALKQRERTTSSRFIDVGTGGGFPGIPLKIALPDIKMVLLEATAKKVSFLNRLIEKLGIQGIDVITGRAEEIAQKPEYRQQFDVVLSRAVAHLPVLVELTLPFCAIGGRVIAQKKGDIQLELEQAIKAIDILGGNLSRVEKVEMEGLDDERYLVVIDKIVLTPAKFPRRPGMPGKRPII